MSKILSGKVKKIPPTDVSDTRYDFLSLSEAEPDLGVPPESGYVLVSQADGTRSWIQPEAVGGFGSGFRYIFAGFSDQSPENGKISFYLSEEDFSYVSISKITNDAQNISDVIKTLDDSTNYNKSYVILKSLEAGSTKFFSFYVKGITESFDYYNLYLSETGAGEYFDEEEKISFEFSRIGDQAAAVSILGTYETLAELELEHPVGVVGSSYIVEESGFLYVWDNTSESWISVGNITGPQGPPGPDPLSLDGGTSSTLFI